jgi:hypothetical protein
MGRGLSDLQKTILRLAYQNHVDEGLNCPHYEVFVQSTSPDEGLDPIEALQRRLHTPPQAFFEDHDKRQQEANNKIEEQVRDLIAEPFVWRQTKYGKDPPILVAGPFVSKGDATALFDALEQRGLPVMLHTHYPGTTAALFTNEILIAAFGFGEYLKDLRGTSNRQGVRNSAGERIAGGVWFDRGKIGEARYNAAVVSVHKALDRLEARGLAEHVVRTSYGHNGGKGICLTIAGVEVAKALLANNPNDHQLISQ